MAKKSRLKIFIQLKIVFAGLCLISSCRTSEKEVCGVYRHKGYHENYTIVLKDGLLKQIFVRVDHNDTIVASSPYKIIWSEIHPKFWINKEDLSIGIRLGGCAGCELSYEDGTIRSYYHPDFDPDVFYKYADCDSKILDAYKDR